MTDRHHMGSRADGRGRRCGTFLFAKVRATLVAADQVACEFVHEQRLEFLAQAVRREHDGVDEPTSRDLATLYVSVDRTGFKP